MSGEFLGGHLLWDSGSCRGDWSGQNSALSFLLGTIMAKMSRPFASEATPLLHQLGLLFWGHGVVGSGDDIDVHSVQVPLWAKGPLWLGLAYVGLR